MPFEFPIRQTIVEEEKRGRILSLYSLVFLGTTPVGSLVAGTVATQLTASHVVHGSMASAAWWGPWCSPTTCPPYGR
jgi:hypothetical protein